MKVLIISGGKDSERSVSLKSGLNVKKALEELGHDARIYDLKNGYSLLKKISKDYAVLFPVLHGKEGEDGRLHKFLKTLNVPFVGSDFGDLETGWYKIPFKEFCKENNIPTAPWKKVNTKEDVLDFGFPCVLKVSEGGSSKEVVILKSPEDLKNPLSKKILNPKSKKYVEKYLEGTEITIGILHGKALPVIEIIPPQNEWFDYKNKYSGKSREIPHAPSVDKKIQEEAVRISLAIHKMLNLGPIPRIDFIIHNNKPHALEANVIPGLTKESLFPKAASAAGIEFDQLIHRLLESAVSKPDQK